MAYSRSNLGKVQISYESAFGTAGSYADLKLREPLDLSPLEQEFTEDGSLRSIDAALPGMVGKKATDLVLPMHIWDMDATPKGSAYAAASEGATTDVHLGSWLIASCLGDYVIGGYGLMTTDASKTAIKINTAAEVSFYPGQLVAITTTLGIEVRRCTTVTGGAVNTITVSPAILGTVTDNGACQGLFTAFLRPDGKYTGLSNSLTHQSLEAAQLITILGMRPISAQIDAMRGEFATCDITMRLSTWDDTASGTAPTETSWDYPRTCVEGGNVLIGGTSYPCKGIHITIPKAAVEISDLSNSTTAGIDDIVAGGLSGISVELECYAVAGSTLATQPGAAIFQAQTTSDVTVFWGSAIGKLHAFNIPAATVQKDPRPVDGEGVGMVRLIVKPNNYTGDTVGDGAAADAVDNTFCWGEG